MKSDAATRPSFALSVDARLLYERLIKLMVDETITYEELTRVIGRDVQTAGHGALATARRVAKRDHQMVFGVIYNKGLKRLSDVEIVGTGDAVLIGIRRKARRGAQTIACVADYAGLPDTEKLRHNATLAVLGVVEQTAKEQNVKRIAGQLAAKGVPSLTAVMERTLEAFKGEGK